MKQFVVIGLGRFGSSVAKTLNKKGCEVLAIDSDYEKVQAFSNEVTHVVQADATDKESLRSVGVNNFDVAVVSIGENKHANILATLILKELGVEYVVSKAQDELHGKLLDKVGADEIVHPERDMGIRIANNLVSANVLDYMELAPHYSITEFIASEEFCGKNLKQLNLREKYGVNIIAIMSDSFEEEINLSPTAEYVVKEDDVLVIIGHDDDLKKLKKED